MGPWQSLSGGEDLSGWVRVNCAPGTFAARDGLIRSTGVPSGVLRTGRQYENFILELEWRHLKPGGNAGLFVWSDPLPACGHPFPRAIEVQILDGRDSENYTSHGDVFAIQGAAMVPDRPHPSGWMRCLPSERRCRPAGEWNLYRVTCNDGRVELAVNGKVVSGGSQCRPRKGYICLEAEGSEVHFRDLRLRELPSTGAGPAASAPPARGFRPLYTGLDLEGWRAAADHRARWKPHDWILERGGKGAASELHLWTEESFGDFTFLCDWRRRGAEGSGRSGILLRGSTVWEVAIGGSPAGSGGIERGGVVPGEEAPAQGAVAPRARADRPPGEWNRLAVTLQGDRIAVELNGQVVVDGASLPGLAPRGPLGLADHGGSFEFANLFVLELDR